ncbi:MAG: type IX secretion system outer membrane channel protein PorV [Prevotellaceae bacterium]|jgi:hypothetical protein|nr:type IX secretion system outer membrane channel protein PorV [Prevotellaceae bacterium]
MWKRYAVLIFLLCTAGKSAVCRTAGDSPGLESDDLIGGHPIKFAMPILVIAPDARAGGMGDIGVATTPSTNDQNWNAAKYIFIESQTGVSLSYIPWLRNIGSSNINLFYLTAYHRFDNKNAIGASLHYFSVGSLDLRDVNNNFLNTTNPSEWAVDFSYSRLLGDHFSMSLTGRYILSDISGGYTDIQRGVRIKAAYAVAADVGLYYFRPVDWGNRDGLLSLGAAISNIGSKMNYSSTGDEVRSYFLPTTLRMGGAWTAHLNERHDIAVHLELSKYLVPTPEASGAIPNVSIFQGMIQSFYDAPGGFSEEMQEIMLGAGLEYTYIRHFMARAGYYHDTKSPNRKYFTVGAGIRYQIYTLDMAYLIPTFSGFTNPLANTIRITLSVDFGHSDRSRPPRTSTKNGESDFFTY